MCKILIQVRVAMQGLAVDDLPVHAVWLWLEGDTWPVWKKKIIIFSSNVLWLKTEFPTSFSSPCLGCLFSKTPPPPTPTPPSLFCINKPRKTHFQHIKEFTPNPCVTNHTWAALSCPLYLDACSWFLKMCHPPHVLAVSGQLCILSRSHAACMARHEERQELLFERDKKLHFGLKPCNSEPCGFNCFWSLLMDPLDQIQLQDEVVATVFKLFSSFIIIS